MCVNMVRLECGALGVQRLRLSSPVRTKGAFHRRNSLPGDARSARARQFDYLTDALRSLGQRATPQRVPLEAGVASRPGSSVHQHSVSPLCLVVLVATPGPRC